MTYNAIFSYCKVNSKYGIGYRNKIPWIGTPQSKADLKLFKYYTIDTIIIMGYNTWLSLPGILKDRIHVIISSKDVEMIDRWQNNNPKLLHFYNPIDCVKYLELNHKTTQKWIIGGSKLFDWFFKNNYVKYLYLSIIRGTYDCDTFLNVTELNDSINDYELTKAHHVFENYMDNDVKYRMLIDELVNVGCYHEIYKTSNVHEKDFLNLINNVLKYGIEKQDRTGVGTISMFGTQLRFSLENNTLPLLTSRKQHFTSIFHELMWILSGSTNVQDLRDKGVNVWNDNSSIEFLQKNNLKLEEGDIGASYGFNMRYYGAEYKTCKDIYSNDSNSTDQLKYVIDLLRTNPDSRRILINLWNPGVLNNCALPPCMMMYQFYVHNGKLSCLAYNRSSDIVVAGGWNVCFASLFTILLAQVCNLEPFELIWTAGDVHIYNNNIKTARDYIFKSAEVHPFPKLFIQNKKTEITDYMLNDLLLVNYSYSKSRKFKMNA